MDYASNIYSIRYLYKDNRVEYRWIYAPPIMKQDFGKYYGVYLCLLSCAYLCIHIRCVVLNQISLPRYCLSVDMVYFSVTMWLECGTPGAAYMRCNELHSCTIHAVSFVHWTQFVLELIGVNQVEAWTEIGIGYPVRVVIGECVYIGPTIRRA